MFSDEAQIEAWDVTVNSLGLRLRARSIAPECGCVMTFAVDPKACGLTDGTNMIKSLVAPAGMSASSDGTFLYGAGSAASGGGLVVLGRNLDIGAFQRWRALLGK